MDTSNLRPTCAACVTISKKAKLQCYIVGLLSQDATKLMAAVQCTLVT